jgi:hypothetical protein
MDIKESLSKIEQYWQIIRNLHFHIEQEGKISPEEYALIEKYLQVITQKYAALIEKEQPSAHESVSRIVQVVAEVKQQEAPIISETPSSIIVAEPVIETPAAEEKIVEPLVPEEEVQVLKSAVSEVVLVELQSTPAKNNAISTYLERMLDEPGAIPASPVVVEQASVRKPSSFNDRMMESRNGKDDLNSKIKKSMSETISLNEKFEFIRELFGNNPVDYATALSYVDARNDSNHAWIKVESEFSDKYKWSTKPGSVDKLRKVVERKFS